MELIRKLWSSLDGSLRTRILIPTAVLSAATLGAMVVSAVHLHGADIDRANRERAELFTDMVLRGIVAALIHPDPPDISEVLRALSVHRADIEWISVIDSDGVVRHSTRPELVGGRAWRLDELASKSFVAPGDRSQLVVLRPLVDDSCARCHDQGKGIGGWLEVRFSRIPVTAAKDRLMQTLALTAIPSLLLLIAISWWLLGREAIRPLQRLVNVMRRAEEGQAHVLADEGRTDELGHAARGFDATYSALQRSRSELEAVYRERIRLADRFAVVGEVATGLAHEIKNPLAGLSGALEILAEDLAGSPRHGEMVAEMKHQVNRLTQIMEAMLDFARPRQPRKQSTDVNETLEKVLFLVAQHRRGKSVAKMERELRSGLPSVWADPAQLEQVFLNICLNACQAMNGHPGTLSVRTGLRAERVTVEVSDTGPGIPLEIRSNIFKPFFTTRQGGNGLGLAISERIVAEHGGHIAFSCPPEGGTVFTVALPVHEPAEEQAA
ncbi:MAG: HAMP domain-containing protein [Myxococcales bacterium]|nr:HAMP domain-containing protein [Myxococcales bacterium]